MYSTVLFPTDGSEGATDALDHALDIARTYDATLHALYVETESGELAGDVDADPVDGEAAIETVRERGEDIEVVGTVEYGDPADVILTYADAAGVDLIVMATRARTGLDRYILGSVTEEVVRSSDAPVLTVRMS